MEFRIGADLYACIFDREAGKHIAKSLGPITHIGAHGISCGGVQFGPGDAVFSTLAEAQAAAAKRNVTPPKPAEEHPSSPDP